LGERREKNPSLRFFYKQKTCLEAGFPLNI